MVHHLVLEDYFPDFPCEDYCIPVRLLVDASQELLVQVIGMHKVISSSINLTHIIESEHNFSK